MDQEEQVGIDLNDPGMECRDFTPVAAVNDLVQDYGDAEPGVNGCDTCLHWQDGRCVLYAARRSY